MCLFQLQTVNKVLTSKGLGMYLFGAMGDNKMQMGPGVRIGLNTLERRGPCSMTDFKNGTLYYDYNLGFRLFFLGYAQFTMDGDSMAGVFKVNKNAIHVSYWLTKANGGCSVELNDYYIPYLDEVTLFSSNPKYGETDVSSLFREYARGKINENMLSQRSAIQEALQKHICTPMDKAIETLHSVVP